MGGWASSTLGALARTAMLAGARRLGFLWWCLQRDQELCQAASLQTLKPLLPSRTQLVPPLREAAGAQHQPEQPRGRHKGKCPRCGSGCGAGVCSLCLKSLQLLRQYKRVRAEMLQLNCHRRLLAEFAQFAELV